MAIELSVLQICLISGTAAGIFITVTILCLSRLRKRKSARIYTIQTDDTIPKKPFYEISNIYRHFTNVWTAEQNRTPSKDYHQSSAEQTLLDSTDVDKNFANSLLRISAPNENICTHQPISLLSHHFSRSNSKCTYLSCCSEDTEEGVIV